MNRSIKTKRSYTTTETYSDERGEIIWEAHNFWKKRALPTEGEIVEGFKGLKAQLRLNKEARKKKGPSKMRGGELELKKTYPALVTKADFFNKLREKHFYDCIGGAYWYSEYLTFELTHGEFSQADYKDFLLVSAYDHTFRNMEGDIIPCLQHVDCHVMGVAAWKEFKLLGEELKKSPFVFNLVCEDVPYYNQDSSGSQCWVFDIYDPSGEAHKVYGLDEFFLNQETLDFFGITAEKRGERE